MKFVLALLFLIVTSTLHADEAVMTSESGALKSREQRTKMKYLAVGQPIGFGPIPDLSTGATFGFYIEPNSILQIEWTSVIGTSSPTYANENGYSSSTSSKAWYPNTKGNSLGVHMKHFVANSLYIKGGVDYRRVERENSYRTAWDTDEYSVRFVGEAWSGAFAIGNQWQFAHFTLGCDWFGIVSPISSNVREESSTGTVKSYGSSLRSDDENRYLSSTSIELTRFYLGASF